VNASRVESLPIPPISLGQLLKLLLDPGRDPSATPAARLEAYRALLRVLEGSLADHEFAQAIHREWIKLSFNAPTRRSRRHGARAAAGC
jgi:hypothetical protein